jgi:hypothetical protein
MAVFQCQTRLFVAFAITDLTRYANKSMQKRLAIVSAANQMRTQARSNNRTIEAQPASGFTPLSSAHNWLAPNQETIRNAGAVLPSIDHNSNLSGAGDEVGTASRCSCDRKGIGSRQGA